MKVPISEFLFPSLIILVLLLIFTILNYNKNKVLTDVIVFFNILIFFIINQPTSILYTDIYNIPVLGNLNYNLLIIGILLPVIGFFLVFRDRIRSPRGMFFSGFYPNYYFSCHFVIPHIKPDSHFTILYYCRHDFQKFSIIHFL